MRYGILACALLALAPVSQAEEASSSKAPTAFAEPFQVMAADGPVAVEAPGFACPAFEDVDGDGLKDLVVGQFTDGKLHMFKNVGTKQEPKFAKGDWIRSGDKPALVPDVW